MFPRERLSCQKERSFSSRSASSDIIELTMTEQCTNYIWIRNIQLLLHGMSPSVIVMQHVNQCSQHHPLPGHELPLLHVGKTRRMADQVKQF